MPPLDRALAFPQVEAVPVPIRENLNLDMSRLVNIALDEDAFVAEAASGLVLGRAEAVAHLRRTMRNTHTLAAAPSRGFDHHREADLFRNAYSFLGRGDFADVARHGADLR